MKILFNIILASLFISTLAFANDKSCTLSNGVNIQTTKRILFICENNQIIQHYKISLGRQGIGKTQQGDKKTPTGLYELSSPRQSKRFKIFIPIKYPTPQQIAHGFTGKDVGIHGPLQSLSWLGSLNTWFNWTQGCIAVGHNQQITFIAKWVRKHPQAKILIN